MSHTAVLRRRQLQRNTLRLSNTTIKQQQTPTPWQQGHRGPLQQQGMHWEFGHLLCDNMGGSSDPPLLRPVVAAGSLPALLRAGAPSPFCRSWPWWNKEEHTGMSPFAACLSFRREKGGRCSQVWGGIHAHHAKQFSTHGPPPAGYGFPSDAKLEKEKQLHRGSRSYRGHQGKSQLQGALENGGRSWPVIGDIRCPFDAVEPRA
jgi:hypothetical protein